MARMPSTMLDLGTSLPDFDLPAANPDVMGDRVSRADLEGAPLVVVFTCNHCPYAVHVEPRLIEQSHEWIEKGVNVVAISSNDADAYPKDSFDEMAERAARLGYPFPYLYDEPQDVARAFDAACTPDFYLFDADGALVYRGRIDDSRPGRPTSGAVPVTTSDLDDAVTELLETGGVTVEQLPSIGCNIKWKPTA
ncbi:thioredoxin family protein [Rubrivirga sp.]|uniref:thioredoxin family protein n=1 Tax=Rubrivirga sp. TaxID=1885344 RepID=UPI003C708405